ncbi:MAG TPA: beta-ketoacyl-ACP synthase II [Acidimicrobiia bacterium]|nr:beta-ketoacyl-ACP synthase II [Acidimicrobiia bacterium]
MSDLDQRGRPRVVVTGVGIKTPAGNNVTSFWEQLRAGRASARTIESFDPAGLSITFAGEVRDFDAVDYFGPKEARRQDRVTQLGFGAAADALGDAGELGADPSRCAVIIATGVGGLHTLEENQRLYFEKGPSRVSPFFVPMMMPNATAGVVAMQLGWTGPNLCVATACAAGAHAIGEGVRLIRDGTADVVMAGGTEAAVTPLTIAAFARMGALSSRNDDPERASRPFDAERDGFVIGEGAGCVVLEPLERARARGATVYGEVAGYGRNADAYHITAPSPGGAGAAVCMQLALDDAGMEPSAIGHVNAHGTSTPLNDAAEAEAIRKVFGDAPPVVTSTKGVTGHLIGAAGAVEAVASLLSVRDGIVPPTANLERVGDDIELDVVAGSPREVGSQPAISNSFGFGGHNASLVLTAAD